MICSTLSSDLCSFLSSKGMGELIKEYTETLKKLPEEERPNYILNYILSNILYVIEHIVEAPIHTALFGHTRYGGNYFMRCQEARIYYLLKSMGMDNQNLLEKVLFCPSYLMMAANSPVEFKHDKWLYLDEDIVVNGKRINHEKYNQLMKKYIGRMTKNQYNYAKQEKITENFLKEAKMMFGIEPDKVKGGMNCGIE